MSAAALGAAAARLAAGGAVAKLQFRPKASSREHFAFGSLIWSPQHGYYLFFYFQPPRP